MQISYTAHAYFDPRFNSLDQIIKGERTPLLAFKKPGDGGYMESNGFVHIGTAAVTLEIRSQDKIVVDQIKALNAQLQAVRSESQQKENAILLQISKLQALTMNEE